MGYRFRLHASALPGTPDIVLQKYQTIVFVHGCFWYRHPGCKYAYTPKSRVYFWNEKFEQNTIRHRRAARSDPFFLAPRLPKNEALYVVGYERVYRCIPTCEDHCKQNDKYLGISGKETELYYCSV